MLDLASDCFVFTDTIKSELSEKVGTAIGAVQSVLKWVTTAESAAKWGLHFADVIKDSRASDASISVSVKLDAETRTPRPMWSIPR